jgi:polyphenol oxidase
MAEAPVFDAPGVTKPFAWQERAGIRYLEARLPGVRAAFSTRLGGVSEGSYRSLNLGILTGDDRARVLRNRELLVDALGREPRGIVMGRQVHGPEVAVRASAPRAREPLHEADAQVTRWPSLTPLVLVADCVPLVLAAPGAVAAVHCGWRGIVAGVIEQALDALRAQADRDGVSAAIGPGIGPCCYEVGAEVRVVFEEAGHGQDVLPDGRVDLALAVRAVLERSGVATDRIVTAGLCTSCNPEFFFSHRRDGGVTGRQGGLAWLDR